MLSYQCAGALSRNLGRNGRPQFHFPTLRYADTTGRQHAVEDRLSPGWQNVLCGAIFLLIWGGCAALGFYAIQKKRHKKRRFLRKM